VSPTPEVKEMRRVEVIAAIRAALLEMVDDEHSMCRVAAEKGIYCHGFAQYSDKELKERYSWLLRRKPDMGREELEELANRWQLARQLVDAVPISCDAQTLEHDTCMGWDEYDDRTLERFHHELLGTRVSIVG